MDSFFRDAVKRIEENAGLVVNPSDSGLRELARKDERTTEFGSPSYVTKIRNRSAKFTEVVESSPPPKEHVELIEKVVESLKGKKLILTERTLCQNRRVNFQCKILYPVEFARIPFMWQKTMFPSKPGSEPDILVVAVPDWGERKMLVDAPSGVSFLLGSDYFGECKKANLRMGMYLFKKRFGGLGLHAGSKLLRVKKKDGKPVDKGAILFGLSGTGKTTLTVHDHELKGEERVLIRQDDVVLMDEKGFCFGTEESFFIKTEGLTPGQKVMYDAATKPSAVLENVFVDENGKVDFLDYSLTSNGRGIVRRKEIRERDESIDLQKANIVIFITRRHDIAPPAAKLSPEQGAAMFMLGESIETSAGDPSKEGQSKREVGTNPFIVGPKHVEGNRFLEILRKNPDMECFVLNTGRVGGKDSGDKITIADSTKIIKEIARETIEWKKDPFWGYFLPKSVPGVETKKLDPLNYYPEKEYRELVERLRAERRDWMKQFPELNPEISRQFT